MSTRPTLTPDYTITPIGEISWTDAKSTKKLIFSKLEYARSSGFEDHSSLKYQYTPDTSKPDKVVNTNGGAGTYLTFALLHQGSNLKKAVDALPELSYLPKNLRATLTDVYMHASNNLLYNQDPNIGLHTHKAADVFAAGIAIGKKVDQYLSVGYPTALEVLHQCGLPYSGEYLDTISHTKFDQTGHNVVAAPIKTSAESYQNEFHPMQLQCSFLKGEGLLFDGVQREWFNTLAKAIMVSATPEHSGIKPKDTPKVYLSNSKHPKKAPHVIEVTESILYTFQQFARDVYYKAYQPIPLTRKATAIDLFVMKNPDLEDLARIKVKEAELNAVKKRNPHHKYDITLTLAESKEGTVATVNSVYEGKVTPLDKTKPLNPERVKSNLKKIDRLVNGEQEIAR